MTNTPKPVTPQDLRNALALCAAKFEVQAAALREQQEELDEEWPGDDDSTEGTYRKEAESLDRMASSVRDLLRSPDVVPPLPAPVIVALNDWAYECDDIAANVSTEEERESYKAKAKEVRALIGPDTDS